MRMVAPGGVLACALNSEELPEKWFRGALLSGGREADRKIQVIEQGSQGEDYRVDEAFPEGRYLKYAVVRVGA